MGNSREDIIRKLFALRERMKRGGTEAEALIAAEKFATMAAKYNIELHELGEEEGGTRVEEGRENGKYNETWRKTCYSAAAKMYMCNYFFISQRGSRDFTITHTFIGEPHNVAIALEMAKFFEDTINRLANEAARENKSETGRSHTDRHRFIRTFRISAADRLMIRVKDYVRRAQEGKLKTEDGTTLPALRDLYETSNELYRRWLEANNVKITASEARDQRLSALGRKLGREGGDRISLSTQIKSGSASSRFALN